jgi:error-prone DNA polymerase
VKGLRQAAAERIVATRPFASTGDLARRAALQRDELEALAHAGALADFGLSRREALWQVAAIERDPTSLLARVRPPRPQAPLPPMSAFEEMAADYGTTRLTTGPHVMTHLRERLHADGVVPTSALGDLRHGARVRVAGHVIVRQRPGTAKGMCFLTLEDETGTANAFLTPPTYERWRVLLNTSPLIEVEGPLEHREGVTHVRVARLRRLDVGAELPAGHDYW